MKLYLVIACCLFQLVASAQKVDNNNIPKLTVKELRTIIDTTQAPMIINFWASWCGPCIREIPWFEKGIAESPVPVKLLLVSLDFPDSYPAQLTRFVQQKGYKSQVIFLDESNADYFIPIIEKKWTGAIPASIFINNSKQYYEFFNHQLTEKRFELELKKLVK